MTTAPPTPPKPHFRWLQFSLRTLMVLMLVLGAGFGWLAYKVNQAREQREAGEAITKLGGRVNYEPASGGLSRTVVVWLGRLWGEALGGDVVSVDLADTQVTDVGLAYLRGLRQLRWLSLKHTSIADGGLRHLQGLMRLDHLDLRNTHVTDVGLEHLRG